MKLVGIKEVSFEKDGKQYEGKRMYFTMEEKNVKGIATESVYISANKNVGDLYIGKEYEVLYNKYGKVTGLIAL